MKRSMSVLSSRKTRTTMAKAKTAKKKAKTKVKKFFFVVREIDTRKEVHRVEVTGMSSEHNRKKVENGLMRKIDLEKFYLDEEETTS